MSNQTKGAAGEKAACAYLKKKGYDILERNHRNPFGEIDIIAVNDDALVFCEVKLRGSEAFGRPREAVTATRAARYRRAAELYVRMNSYRGIPLRFDVIEVLKGEITHLENAF